MPRPPAPIQDVDRIIGANLRAIRNDRCFPQPVLAERIGISESMLSKVENGHARIRVDTLELAAKTLAVEPGAFFATAVLA